MDGQGWTLEAAEEGSLVLAAELLLEICQILNNFLSLLVKSDPYDVLQVLVEGQGYFLDEIADRFQSLDLAVDGVAHLDEVLVHHFEFFVEPLVTFELRYLVEVWTALFGFFEAELVLRVEGLAFEGAWRVPHRPVLLLKYHASLMMYVVLFLNLVKITIFIEYPWGFEGVATCGPVGLPGVGHLK